MHLCPTPQEKPAFHNTDILKKTIIHPHKKTKVYTNTQLSKEPTCVFNRQRERVLLQLRSKTQRNLHFDCNIV